MDGVVAQQPQPPPLPQQLKQQPLLPQPVKQQPPPRQQQLRKSLLKQQPSQSVAAPPGARTRTSTAPRWWPRDSARTTISCSRFDLRPPSSDI